MLNSVATSTSDAETIMSMYTSANRILLNASTLTGVVAISGLQFLGTVFG